MKRLTALVVLAFLGCQQTEVPTTDIDTPESQTHQSDIEEATKAKAVAAREELFKQLSSRLMEVMKSDGPAAAIEVCSKEASQFADNVGKQHGVKIGRTARKLRNPSNVVPAWATKLATEDAVDPQFVEIDEHTAGALLPIKLQQKCLACHGPMESLAPEVRTQLTKSYPNDQATGFNEGDLRGWFWVEVPKA